MDSLMSGLVAALRRTYAGTVVQDVLIQLGDRAADVRVVALEHAAQTASLSPLEYSTRLSELSTGETTRDLTTSANRVLKRDGHIVIVTDLSRPDDFLGIVSPSALNDSFPKGVEVTGDCVLELLLHEHPDEGDYLDTALAAIPRPFDADDPDPFGDAVRDLVSAEAIANIVTALPPVLVRTLAAVSDGRPAALLQLLGPGSSLLLAEYRLIELGSAPPRLTKLGGEVADAAAVVLSSVHTERFRQTFAARALEQLQADLMNVQ